MNNKLILLVILIFAVMLASLVVRDGKLMVLSMPFLAYLITGLIQAPTSIALEVRRSVNKPGVVAQEPVETNLKIRNQGGTLKNLYLSDTHFPSMRIQSGQTYRRTFLSPGETIDLGYGFVAERGLYSWASIQAVASDPFGLFELKQEIPARGELAVRPPSINLGHLSLRPTMTLHSAGPISIRLSGSSTDFLGVREYRSGDSLRHLNWRLAGRHPRELFTNEYEREEIGDFGLILDARRLTDAIAMEEELFESSIRAVLALSELFLKEGNRVSLLIFGENMDSLFPGYGKKQLHRIEWSLARAKLGASLPLGYLEYFPTRLFPSRSIMTILSPLGTYDYDTYVRLRSFGYEILLISPDPVDYVSRTLPLTEINQLAVRAARVERRVQLMQLIKLGVKVIDWQVNQPLQKVLQIAGRYLSDRRST